MAGSLIVRQARLALADRVVVGDLAVEDGIISEIAPRVPSTCDQEIDGSGLALLPGVIDTDVRLDACEDLATLSGHAATHGVTTILGSRSIRTRDALKGELARGVGTANAHFGMFVEATADNLEELLEADRARAILVPGAVLESSGAEALFKQSDKLLVVDHVLPERLANRHALYPDVDDPTEHPRIEDVDSAVAATRRALQLAKLHGGRTHLRHVSCAEEVALLGQSSLSQVTGAVRLPHLTLGDRPYERLGTRAVTSPPLRGRRHRESLWQALLDETITVVSSGHHPVKRPSKDLRYPETHPGMPGVDVLLPLVLDLALAHGRSLSEVAALTAERPARAFGIARKGRLETGYDADLVLVDLERTRVVGDDAPVSPSCGWSPWEGRALRGWPVTTILLGEVVADQGRLVTEGLGRAL